MRRRPLFTSPLSTLSYLLRSFSKWLTAFLIDYKPHPHHASTGIRELKTDVTTAKAMRTSKRTRLDYQNNNFQWWIQGRGPGGGRPPPLFLDENEARRAEKIFFEAGPPPYLRVWMTGPPPPPIWKSGSATDFVSAQLNVFLFLPSLYDHDVNSLISHFIAIVNIRRRISAL